MRRVNRNVLEITKVQQKEADKDAASMGIGMILFWPALFFMIGEDKKEELASLKGEFEALESAAILKECELTKELDESHKQREKYKEERKELMESTIDAGKDSGELYTELKKLEKLRDSMIITEQEFDVLKKRLLEKY